MQRRIMSLMAMVCVLTLSAQRLRVGELSSGMSIYDFKVKDDLGKDVSLSDYKGKVMLIVNTATRCGFTPQYKELEALYEKYRSEGLEILDFPCNQFGQQAPGTIQEIHQFCTANFDIQFPQFDKIEVNGEGAHPLYTWLKAGNDIKWNFTKFLVSRDGKVLKRYEPRDKISDIEADIQLEVNPVLSSIMARRSIRKYLDKPVEHEKLEAIVKCGLKLNGKDKTLRVLNLPDIHTLDADSLSTQLVGYLLSNSLTAVVHDNNRFMFHIHKNFNCASRHHTSWCSGILTEKGWSSDFPPLPSAFSDNRLMAFMLRSHNGVHCCGTVGDSHPVHYVHLFWPQHSSSKLDSAFGLRKRSQLIAAKRTFTGDSFQNHDAKIVQIE